MKVTRVCFVLAGALSLAGILNAAAVPEAAWRKNCDGARQAFQQGKYAEAEKLLLAAARQAEAFGPRDPRLAATLNLLGDTYLKQDKLAPSGLVLRRALAIREKALGEADPVVAQSLTLLASVYRAEN